MQQHRARRGGPAHALVVAAVVGALLSGVLVTGPAVASTAWSVNLRTGSHAQAKGETAPTAPTGVTAVCQGGVLNGNVIVSWSAVTHASIYQVYQSTTSGGTYTAVGSTTAGLTQTVTPGLLGIGTFFFKVRATGGTLWLGPLSAAAGPRNILSLVACS